MTGFGEAQVREADVAVSVEVRTVNNKYFKLTVKCAEGYGVLENEIEQAVRDQIRRGSIQVGLRVDRSTSADDYLIDKSVLAAYRKQLQALHSEWHVAESVPLETLLSLPGAVVQNPNRASYAAAQWPIIKRRCSQRCKTWQDADRRRPQHGCRFARQLRCNSGRADEN